MLDFCKDEIGPVLGGIFTTPFKNLGIILSIKGE